jgi:ABC-type amino acid transport system permease subunit
VDRSAALLAITPRTLMGFEIMAFVWIAYTIICYPLTALGRGIEKRLRRRGQTSLAGVVP